MNCDYKIISNLLAERLKNVLIKLIHPDQKGLIKGRNISETNRMIRDIIQYVDEEDEEGIIVFLDQQKAFDRVEWGWVDFVLKAFNFRGWIQMLVKSATTSIKTNGFFYVKLQLNFFVELTPLGVKPLIIFFKVFY